VEKSLLLYPVIMIVNKTLQPHTRRALLLMMTPNILIRTPHLLLRTPHLLIRTPNPLIRTALLTFLPHVRTQLIPSRSYQPLVRDEGGGG
jgi:hypothetical protein